MSARTAGPPGPSSALSSVLPHGSSRLTRGAGTILFLFVLAVLLAYQYQLRHLEAVGAARLFGLGTPTLAASRAPIVYFGLGRPDAFGLTITPECSSTLLIAPVFLIGGAMLLGRRMTPQRVLAAVGAAAFLLVVGNQLRIGLIAYLISELGFHTGYEWGHLVLGTVVSIVFIGASLTLLVAVLSTGRTHRQRAAA
ncbi:putative membrane protein [Candidatus Protofrankia californiensis]|uniref:Putative membrane protein n=1 Tax=Candidatus Protofrankia californiensis TaxID=1839754 RepID=A0A1C3NTP5_9ACTN|nr:putative membrane protein [Candidatus Protofrankia californiensis]